jgi:hypothetical protein
MTMDIDEVIASVLTKPQRAEIKRMTYCGFSKIEAVRRLLRLGVLVRATADLETDLIYGTHFVHKERVE